MLLWAFCFVCGPLLPAAKHIYFQAYLFFMRKDFYLFDAALRHYSRVDKPLNSQHFAFVTRYRYFKEKIDFELTELSFRRICLGNRLIYVRMRGLT